MVNVQNPAQIKGEQMTDHITDPLDACATGQTVRIIRPMGTPMAVECLPRRSQSAAETIRRGEGRDATSPERRRKGAGGITH